MHHRSTQMTKEAGARQEDGISSVPSNRRSEVCDLSCQGPGLRFLASYSYSYTSKLWFPTMHFNFLCLQLALQTLRVKDGYQLIGRLSQMTRKNEVCDLQNMQTHRKKSWKYTSKSIQNPNLLTVQFGSIGSEQKESLKSSPLKPGLCHPVPVQLDCVGTHQVKKRVDVRNILKKRTCI